MYPNETPSEDQQIHIHGAIGGGGGGELEFARKLREHQSISHIHFH